MLEFVDIDAIHTNVQWADGTRSKLPNLWLRDNCSCPDCRVAQTQEKKFLLSTVSAQLRPHTATLDNDTLSLEWPDGHVTHIEGNDIRTLPPAGDSKPEYWASGFVPDRVDYAAFLDVDESAAAAIARFLTTGVLVFTGMPCASGTLERLQPRLGCIRDMPFGRLHEVLVDPAGYNVAHTALPLPPHNDFASSSWPPSVQALHMLANECEGGETVIVDGWAVADQLRTDRPDMFDVLCRVPVPFRMFGSDEETYAVNPLIRLDANGRIVHLRYSNQLMQPMSPQTPHLSDFYLAYHELSQRLTDNSARVAFRLEGGQCLLVAGHRVLHARNAFKPTGRRHLQDAYFEHDCIRNHLTVINRRPGSTT